MPKAKKEVVDKNDDDKTLMEIENINPKKTKSKKIKEVVVAKEDKVEPKKDKVKEDKKPKSKEQKDMTDKELKKELKNKDKEIDRIKKLVLKMNEIIE